MALQKAIPQVMLCWLFPSKSFPKPKKISVLCNFIGRDISGKNYNKKKRKRKNCTGSKEKAYARTKERAKMKSLEEKKKISKC